MIGSLPSTSSAIPATQLVTNFEPKLEFKQVKVTAPQFVERYRENIGDSFSPQVAILASKTAAEANTITFPGKEKTKVETKPELDTRNNDVFNTIVAKVDAEISSGQITSAKKKEQVIERMLNTSCGNNFKSLPENQKAEIKKFLMSFDLNELMAYEIQGKGGKDKGNGVTGSGKEGHYTNSIFSSVIQLVNTDRMTPVVTAALNNFKVCPLNEELLNQRNSLIKSTLQEIAFPESISQHNKATCAPTTVQILYSIKTPEKYVKMVEALASPDGKVPAELLFGGGHMERSKETLKTDDSGRSISSRLIQPSFMVYAKGDSILTNYDNKSDKTTTYLPLDEWNTFREINSGLKQAGTNHLLQGLYGASSVNLITGKGKDIMPDILRSLSKGEPVSVGMRWSDSAHQVLLTKVDKGANLAYFMNPWGELNTMPLDQLTERVKSASLFNSSGSGKDAISLLSGNANDPTKYTPVNWQKFQTEKEHLDLSPTFKNFSNEQKQKIIDKCTQFTNLSPAEKGTELSVRLSLIDRLETALQSADNIQAGILLNGFLECKDIEAVNLFLGMKVDVELNPEIKKLSPEQQKNIIDKFASFPNLNTKHQKNIVGILETILSKNDSPKDIIINGFLANKDQYKAYAYLAMANNVLSSLASVNINREQAIKIIEARPDKYLNETEFKTLVKLLKAPNNSDEINILIMKANAGKFTESFRVK
jgi:hypothetical protein